MKMSSACLKNSERRINILIGCSGSVATLKLPVLVQKLIGSERFEIKVVTTEHARHFFTTEDIPNQVSVMSDEDEWKAWNKRGDPVVHIELGKWADLFVIAPLDANTLAKLSTGICDNLLTCTARAWDSKKPLLFCPAMNTRMWEHPITAAQVSTLVSWGYTEIPVVSKTLICGDSGLGAMAEVDTIYEAILQCFCHIVK